MFHTVLTLEFIMQNMDVKKLLDGCGPDRVAALRAKLNKNELSDETVDVLDKFVDCFAQRNAAGVTENYQWLTKNKYTEVSAKVMLGLKKIQNAVEKIEEK